MFTLNLPIIPQTKYPTNVGQDKNYSVGIKLILIDHPSSPTINSSLNCGRIDKPKPSPKVGIVPKVKDKKSAFGFVIL